MYTPMITYIYSRVSFSPYFLLDERREDGSLRAVAFGLCEIQVAGVLDPVEPSRPIVPEFFSLCTALCHVLFTHRKSHVW